MSKPPRTYMSAGCARRVRRARIETGMPQPQGPSGVVAPAACGGRGLKLTLQHAHHDERALRPPRAAGED